MNSRLSPQRPARPPTRGRSGLRTGLAAAAVASLAATALGTGNAQGTVVDVAPNHNITVFQNIDFVAVFGHELGEEVTVRVVRNGVTIGTATGEAAGTAPEIGLEVNHGPEGTPVAGDCWVGGTPDIRPRDRIVVSSAAGTDRVVVDNIKFTGRPRALDNGDIVVPFLAKRANGRAIPAKRINSAEFRAASNNQVRFEGNRIAVQRRPGAKPGNLWMRYRAPFRPSRNDDQNPFNQRQLRRALLRDGHAIGFGHVDPLPREGMLVDGLKDTPGPAPGCPGLAARWQVSRVSPAQITRRNVDRGLTVRGRTFNAERVQVMLRDKDRSTPPRVVQKRATVTARRWTVSFTRRQLRGLNGRIVVSSRHTLNGQTRTIGGPAKIVRKNLSR